MCFSKYQELAEPRKPSQFARAPSVGHDGFDDGSFWGETWAGLRPSCTHLKQGSTVALPQAGTADQESMFHAPHSSPALVRTCPWSGHVPPGIPRCPRPPPSSFGTGSPSPVGTACLPRTPRLVHFHKTQSGNRLTLSDLLRPGLCSHPCPGGS